MIIKKKLIFKAIAILLFFSILAITIFLGAECYLRLRFFSIAFFNDLAKDRMKINAMLHQAMDTSLWQTPWRDYKKNTEVKLRINNEELQFKLNNYGYRTKDIQVPKPKDKYRILCVGGSATFEGRTNALTFPSLLEEKLNKYFETDKIEVYNCGISGLTSAGERERMDDFIALDPDLIIEYNLINDIFWVMESNKKKALGPSIMLSSVFINKTFLKFNDQEVKNFFDSFTIPNLKSIFQKAKSHKVKLVFCSFISPEFPGLSIKEKDFFGFDLKTTWRSSFIGLRDYYNYVKMYNEDLKKMCEKNNILFIPLAENFNGEINDFWDLCHLTSQGIAKKTEIVFNYLKPFLANELERL